MVKAYKNNLVPLPVGEDANNAVLTEKQVIKIKSILRSTSLPQHKIGSMFGVARTTISSIKNGHSWTHVK